MALEQSVRGAELGEDLVFCHRAFPLGRGSRLIRPHHVCFKLGPFTLRPGPASAEKGAKGALEERGPPAYKRADPPLRLRESVPLRPEVPKGFR
jgi:hypothetical protein